MDFTQVILVDEKDAAVGVCEKMEAHKKGLLHRAFSVFIFNTKGKMLLQQRALNKYHSGGLWTNACCSHPASGEATILAATRRLQEELGFIVYIKKAFDFIYQADFDNGLIEHEYDHVYIGQYDGDINFNKEEVMAICYKSISEISNELQTASHNYTAWFHIAFPKIEEWWKQRHNDKEFNFTIK